MHFSCIDILYLLSTEQKSQPTEIHQTAELTDYIYLIDFVVSSRDCETGGLEHDTTHNIQLQSIGEF